MATTYAVRAFGSTLIFSDPLKITSSIRSQALVPSVTIKQALFPVLGVKQALNLTQGLLQMPAPNTTIYSTLTVTDSTGVLVSNLSAVSLVVTFPDGTTSNLGLGSGITNLGSGQYRATYNTKGVGTIRENWAITAADGTTTATYQDYFGVVND